VQALHLPEHELELFAVIVRASHGPVCILLDDGIAMGSRPPLRLRPLPLNGLLTLAVAGIAVICDGRAQLTNRAVIAQ